MRKKIKRKVSHFPPVNPRPPTLSIAAECPQCGVTEAKSNIGHPSFFIYKPVLDPKALHQSPKWFVKIF